MFHPIYGAQMRGALVSVMGEIPYVELTQRHKDAKEDKEKNLPRSYTEFLSGGRS